MELRSFGLERYRGYADPTEMELAPLTILVGANNSGKTALAQAIQLLAGGLAPSESENSEPLPLVSGGIRHGQEFRRSGDRTCGARSAALVGHTGRQ